MPIQIFIVDPHEIMRTGISLALGSMDEFEVVGETESMLDAFDQIRRTNPEVLIVDPRACGTEGLPLLHRFHQTFADVKILVFTANDSAQHAAELMQIGASGYLIKKAGIDELSLAIRCLHIGRNFIVHTHHAVGSPKSVADAPVEVKKSAIESSFERSELDSHEIDLSGREREVLTLIAEGMTNKQAAAKLFLSVKTVETYRARVMRKNQLKDRRDLVRFAKQLVDLMAQVG